MHSFGDGVERSKGLFLQERSCETDREVEGKRDDGDIDCAHPLD